MVEITVLNKSWEPVSDARVAVFDSDNDEILFNDVTDEDGKVYVDASPHTFVYLRVRHIDYTFVEEMKSMPLCKRTMFVLEMDPNFPSMEELDAINSGWFRRNMRKILRGIGNIFVPSTV